MSDTKDSHPATQQPTVAVLEADPQLGAGLTNGELQRAQPEATAPLLCAEIGEWSWAPNEECLSGHLGLLVLDGLLARNETVGELVYTELLGSGDVLRPWVSGTGGASGQTGWRVLSPARLALLDHDFAQRIQHWPQIASALLDRAIMRSRSLSASLAIHRAVRIQDRVQMMLWHLAGRWGQRTPEGMLLPIPLTHESLAQLVGSRRPPVSAALKQLEREELVQRASDRSWLLRGEPVTPDEPKARPTSQQSTTVPF